MDQQKNERGEKRMSQPKIAAKKPVILELTPGTYKWCQCGLSLQQPYCDGSHRGTEFFPLPFTIKENKKVALCMCKQTKHSPFCDGTHSKLA